MSKVNEKGTVHIVAKNVFTDLTKDLTNRRFLDAGHFPSIIYFSDKCKASEIRGGKKDVKLPKKLGFSLFRSQRSNIKINMRMQITQPVKISPIHITQTTDFDGIFPALCKTAPEHFNDNEPARIKKLITKNVHNGAVCTWTKILIQVATDKKGEPIEEYRLILNKIDNKSVTINDLDFAEECSAGMIETICETHDVYTHVKQVCSLVAKRIKK